MNGCIFLSMKLCFKTVFKSAIITVGVFLEDDNMKNDDLLVVIKGLFDKKTDEIKHYVDEKINGQGTLIESLRSDIKAVAEGHDILSRKIDAVDKKVEDIKRDMVVVKDYVIGVDAKLNEHEIILKRVK